jgi:hypothetical protein
MVRLWLWLGLSVLLVALTAWAWHTRPNPNADATVVWATAFSFCLYLLLVHVALTLVLGDRALTLGRWLFSSLRVAAFAALVLAGLHLPMRLIPWLHDRGTGIVRISPADVVFFVSNYPALLVLDWLGADRLEPLPRARARADTGAGHGLSGREDYFPASSLVIRSRQLLLRSFFFDIRHWAMRPPVLGTEAQKAWMSASQASAPARKSFLICCSLALQVTES